MNDIRADQQETVFPRLQRTLRRPAEIRGIGFFTGADVTLRLLPAEENHGLVFQRVDCIDAPRIPADIAHAIPRQRRTALGMGNVTVELTEHILAAMVGLQIDNCLMQLDAPELPGCDGSSQQFVDAILTAEIVEQTAPRLSWAVERPFQVCAENGKSDVSVTPLSRSALTIGYELNYGSESPIPPQILHMEITPKTFLEELAFTRTFVLESEVKMLRTQGFGLRVTENDLLVFQDNGELLGNELRIPNECVRHKILDCLGDFALFGCDLFGHFNAYRSGHELNREVVRRARQQQQHGLQQQQQHNESHSLTIPRWSCSRAA